MIKYEFTGDEKQYTNKGTHKVHTVKRIKALRNIGKSAKAFEYGGWIESYNNLPQDDNSWIDENTIVLGDAIVKDSSYVKNSTILDGAMVCGHSDVDNCYLDETTTIESSTICNIIATKDTYILNSNIDSGFINTNNGNIMNPGDIVVMSGLVPFIEDGDPLKVSFYKDRNNDVCVNYRAYIGKLKSFEDYVISNCPECNKKEWIAILDYIKMHFGITGDVSEGEDTMVPTTNNMYNKSVGSKTKELHVVKPEIPERKVETELYMMHENTGNVLKINSEVINTMSKIISLASTAVSKSNDITKELSDFTKEK